MSVTPLRARMKAPVRAPTRAKRVYAIAFDIDTGAAAAAMGDNWKSAYTKIEAVLREHGFSRRQGSVYFGDENSNAVSCVVAVQEIDAKFAWFGKIIRDLRMLRVDEDNDLLPVLSTRLRFDEPNVA